MAIETTVGERLRILRERRELTQDEIAELLGTSQSYYAQYENAKRQIPLDRAARLAEFYNVSMDYICGLSEDINRGFR